VIAGPGPGDERSRVLAVRPYTREGRDGSTAPAEGARLEVTVAGEAADIGIGVGLNGSFEHGGVRLAAGAKEIDVVARDALGNEVRRVLSVTRVVPEGPILEATASPASR